MKTTPDRDKPVTIKLSKPEKRLLEAICKSRGISKSEYFRQCIRTHGAPLREARAQLEQKARALTEEEA